MLVAINTMQYCDVIQLQPKRLYLDT